MTQFSVVIPARMGSERLPGKPLREIGGRPMVAHVQARAWASGATRVIVASEDQRVADVARDAGGEGIVTSGDHPTGTDRIAEVVKRMSFADDEVIVNLQGDEPLMPPGFVTTVAADLGDHPNASIASLATPLEHELSANPNYVKVVTDGGGYALYFSRAAIPYPRGETDDAAGEGGPWLRHLGLYAYRAGFLRRFPQLSEPCIEHLEKLEQLRALWHGYAIHIARVEAGPEPGVDTVEDLERVAAYYGDL